MAKSDGGFSNIHAFGAALKRLPNLWKRAWVLILLAALTQVMLSYFFELTHASAWWWIPYIVIVALTIIVASLLIQQIVPLLVWRRDVPKQEFFQQRVTWFIGFIFGFFCSIYIYFGIVHFLVIYIFKVLSINNAIVEGIAIMILCGLPAVYFIVNFLVIPYLQIIEGRHLWDSIRLSTPLVVPHWFQAFVVFAVLLFYYIFTDVKSPIFLRFSFGLPLSLLISFVLKSLLFPIALLWWMDMCHFCVDSLGARVSRAKEMVRKIQDDK